MFHSNIRLRFQLPKKKKEKKTLCLVTSLDNTPACTGVRYLAEPIPSSVCVCVCEAS